MQDVARQGTKDISKISDQLISKLQKLLKVRDQRVKQRRRREQTKANIREIQGSTITEGSTIPEDEETQGDHTHHGIRLTHVSHNKKKTLPAIEKTV